MFFMEWEALTIINLSYSQFYHEIWMNLDTDTDIWCLIWRPISSCEYISIPINSELLVYGHLQGSFIKKFLLFHISTIYNMITCLYQSFPFYQIVGFLQWSLYKRSLITWILPPSLVFYHVSTSSGWHYYIN